MITKIYKDEFHDAYAQLFKGAIVNNILLKYDNTWRNRAALKTEYLEVEGIQLIECDTHILRI